MPLESYYCKKCNKELTGKQRMFCSGKCKVAYFRDSVTNGYKIRLQDSVTPPDQGVQLGTNLSIHNVKYQTKLPASAKINNNWILGTYGKYIHTTIAFTLGVSSSGLKVLKGKNSNTLEININEDAHLTSREELNVLLTSIKRFLEHDLDCTLPEFKQVCHLDVAVPDPFALKFGEEHPEEIPFTTQQEGAGRIDGSHPKAVEHDTLEAAERHMEVQRIGGVTDPTDPAQASRVVEAASTLEGLIGVIKGQNEVIGKVAQELKTFGVGMEQHMTLITALQGTAQSLTSASKAVERREFKVFVKDLENRVRERVYKKKFKR